MLALPSLLLSWQMPIVGQDERGVASWEWGMAGVGWLTGMKYVGGIVEIERGFRTEKDLEDVSPFQLEEDVILRKASDEMLANGWRGT